MGASVCARANGCDFSVMAMEDIEAELTKETESSLREKFETLALTAGKIENGQIDLQEIFSRCWKGFSKELMIAAFIIAAVATGVWVWMKTK